jgi:hypothetical protein
VAINSSGNAILPTGASAPVVGILQNDPSAAGQAATIRRFGDSKMKLGGTVAPGDNVRVDSAGRAVTASAGDVAAGAVIGKCLKGGDINNIGTVMLHALGAGTTLTIGQETVTSGALDEYVRTSYLSVTGTVAFSLADGLYLGQEKFVECTAVSGTPIGTLTLNDAHGTEPTSHIFGAVGQRLGFEWTATGWKLTSIRSAGRDTPAAASTLNLLILHHAIAIVGTQDWVIPSGLVPGQKQIVIVLSAASTPVGTVSGLFYDNADGSADAIDVTWDSGGDAGDFVELTWDGARWFMGAVAGAPTT